MSKCYVVDLLAEGWVGGTHLRSEILPRAIRGECMERQICAEFQFLRLDQLLVIALALIQEIQFRLDSYASDSESSSSSDSEL